MLWLQVVHIDALSPPPPFLGHSFMRYNSHSIQSTHLKYTGQWFGGMFILIELWHSQFWNTFITPRSKYALAITSNLLPRTGPQPLEIHFPSVLMDLPILDILYK